MVRIRNRWPVKVVVREKRGDYFFEYFDKGRREFDKDKHIIYKLKTGKRVTRPVEYDYISPGNVLHVFSPDPENFIPTTFDSKDSKYKVLDTDTRQWTLMRYRSMWERYNPKSGWEKWAWILVILITCIGIGLMIWFSYQGQANMQKEYNNGLDIIATKIGEFADKVAVACKTNPTPVTVPPS